ncbi:hypothetical protein C3433_24490 [Citrobacter freundii]|nr:hypothetical protein C3433_24490 [Citrobacter freundii]
MPDALRLSVLRSRYRFCRPDKALSRIRLLRMPDALRLSGLRSRYRFCRPDKAFLQHPATADA